MNTQNTTKNDQENYIKIKQYMAEGNFRAAEQLAKGEGQTHTAILLQRAANEVTESSEGKDKIKQLRDTYHYRAVNKQKVTVTIVGEQKITITSYYALAGHKKRGRRKAGRNGSGSHILLDYWGFHHKRSPGSFNEITRCGTAAASCELASEHLKSQDIKLSPKGVRAVTKKVGDVSVAKRTTHHLALAEGESLAGKRVGIGCDGGRVRTRKNKTGRKNKIQRRTKRTRYYTDWMEPKLLVIYILDKYGNKKKGTKPIYEATMGGKKEFAELLISLCEQLHLNEAKEIVLLGDGAPVIWNVFEQLQTKLRIKGKTTEVVDFYHACEHITELTEAHTNKSSKEQKAWFKELKGLLRAGKHQAFIVSVKHEAKVHNLPLLLKHLNYFKRHKQRMHYDQYAKANLPIGSGTVESAVRRVINLRLKAPGTFWKEENIDHMLSLRSALLSGRWDTFMSNFIQTISIRPTMVE